MPNYQLSQSSKANREGVDSRLIEISDLAIQITLVDFGHGPYSGLRSVGDQQHLYADGKSKADGVTNKSKHQSGKAIDFYAYVDGRATWEPKYMAVVGAAFLQAASMLGHRVKWGGLWYDGDMYGWDMAHIELIDD